MDEESKKRLKKIEERLDKIEEFLGEIPTFEISSHYEAGDEVDELYDKALWISLQHDRVSASLLQRRMQIGFNRAARLLEQLEENGILEKRDDNVPRKVLVSQVDIDELRKKLDEKQEKLKEDKKKN